MNQVAANTDDTNQSSLDACEPTVTTKQDGPLPRQLEAEITCLPADARADILCLGEFLRTLAPSAQATVYIMERSDNPEVFLAFGDTIQSDSLACVYVREEDLYQDAIRSWNGVHIYDPRGENREWIFSVTNFDGRQAASWLNIEASNQFSCVIHDAKDTGAIYALLIGPSKSTLFNFAFDFEKLERQEDLMAQSITETPTEDSSPLGWPSPEHQAIDWFPDGLDDVLLNLYGNVKLTPTYRECHDWFGVKNGEIHYGDYLDGYFGPEEEEEPPGEPEPEDTPAESTLAT